MVNILNYKLNATEWAILIHTKSAEEIKAAYFSQREKSDRADREKDHSEPFRMLSEHFRMFLSNFAKECNSYLGRKGVVVMKRFDKYPISTQMIYHQEFDRICDLKFCNYQQIKEKYRADKELYDVDNLLVDQNSEPHVLRSGNRFYSRGLTVENMPIDLLRVKPNTHVLRKILQKDKIIKNPEKPPPKNN